MLLEPETLLDNVQNSSLLAIWPILSRVFSSNSQPCFGDLILEGLPMLALWQEGLT